MWRLTSLGQVFAQHDQLLCFLASTATACFVESSDVKELHHPLSTDAGDLFTALLLAHTFRFPDCLKSALETAMAGLQSVLGETVRASGEAAHSEQKTAAISAARELRLVQCQDAIVEPAIKYKARALSLDKITVQT